MKKSRWLRRALWLLLAVFTVCAVGLALLPRLVSSGWARGRVEALASGMVQRPVRLGGLRVTWGGEVRLEGLAIADAPAFSTAPLLSVQRLRLQVDPLALIRRRLDLDVALDGLDVRVIRAADGRTNLEAFLAGLPPRPPRAAGPLQLPFDQGKVKVRLTGISVLAEDRAQGRTAAIENGAVSLDVPALDQPVTAELRAGLTVDGRPLPPLRLAARVEKLVRPDRTLNLDGAVVEADGAFPGGALTLRVDLARSVARGSMEVDLPRLMDVARPFAPSRIAATRVGGRLAATLDSTASPDGSIAFEAFLAGAGVEAAGGLVEGRRLGPVKFEIQNAGTIDAARTAVVVERGRLALQERTRASWRLAVTGLKGHAAEVTAGVGPATLDLQELVPLAVPFLPRGLAVRLAGAGRPASVTLQRLDVAGPVAGGARRVALQGLAISLPRFGVTSAPRTEVSGGDLALSVERLTGGLAGFFPERLAVQASFRCERLRITGAQAIAVEGLEARASKLELADIARSPSLLGVTLRGNGTHALGVRRLEIPRVARVRGYRHAGEGEFAIRAGDVVSLRVMRGTVSVASASAEVAGTSVRLDAAAARPSVAGEMRGLRVSGPLPDGPLPIELDHASLALPRVVAKTGAGEVTAAGARLAMDALTAVLVRQFPERIALRGAAGLDRLDLSGDRQASIRGLDLASLEVGVSELARSGAALLGVAAKVRLSQSLTVKEMALPTARLTDVSHSAKLGGAFDARGSAQLAVEAFALGLGSVETEVRGVGTVQTAARIGGRLDRVRLRGWASTEIDVDGLRASVAAGDIVTGELEASAAGLGWVSLTTRGTARLDLAALTRTVPLPALRDGKFSGTADVEWTMDGKLPGATGAEAADSRPAGLIGAVGLDFLHEAALSARLVRVGIDLPLAGGQRLALAGVSTEAPLEAVVRSGRATLRAALGAERVEATPGLGAIAEPFGATLRVRGEQTGPGSVRLSESLAVGRLGLTQEMQASVSGLDRLLARGLGSPLPAWLLVLDGDARASLGLAEAAELGLAAENVALRGPVNAGVDLRLARGEELRVGAWLKSAGLDAAVKDRLEAKGLKSDVVLEKRYRLARVAGEAAPRPSVPPRLSEEVLDGRRGESAARGPRDAIRFGSGSSLALGSVRLAAAPLPVQAEHVGVELALVNGLPAIDRFRAEMLGGSLVGSLAIAPGAGPGAPGLAMKLVAAFTGLDAARLVPGAAGAGQLGGEDAEVSGHVTLSVPLRRRLESVLAGVEMQTTLSHIGPRALDRALYALDPSESNETIVRQRKLLRLGSPRRVTMGLRNGNLSVSGQVQAVGLALELPRLERVNVAGLPGLERYEASLAGLGPIFDLLAVASADVLEIDDAGAVRFRKEDAR